MKEFKFIIEKTKTGYSGFSDEYSVFTTGKTIYELQKNALEALSLYFEDDEISLTLNEIAFEIDFKQFFEFYKFINVKHLAERINMNESLLSQYVNGVKKISKKQVDKIVDGLNGIGKELMELTLV